MLKPDGELVVMLYAHRSLNYLLSIALLRRAGQLCLCPPRLRPKAIIYGKHVENARRLDLWRYCRIENFIHRNTDGPANPYAKGLESRRGPPRFPRLYSHPVLPASHACAAATRRAGCRTSE
jgi:hypothetical protein